MRASKNCSGMYRMIFSVKWDFGNVVLRGNLTHFFKVKYFIANVSVMVRVS